MRRFSLSWAEIEHSRALRFYGAALALVNVGTALLWKTIFKGSLVIIKSGDPISFCWPYFADCAQYKTHSFYVAAFVLYLYLAISLSSIPFFFSKRWVSTGMVLLAISTLFKFGIFNLDYRAMGNYHYMAFIVTFAYLILPNRRVLIPSLLVAFYIAAASLKLSPEWLSGAPLIRPTFVNAKILSWLLGYVIVLQVFMVWGLLAARSWIFWMTLLQFILFHAFSYHIVGIFFPFVMFCLLSYLVLDRLFESERSPKSVLAELFKGRAKLTTYATLFLFGLAQLVPVLIPGDEALTGEGKVLSLDMMNAKTECIPYMFARYKGRTVELTEQRKDFGPHLWCDPIVYWNIAHSICRDEVHNTDFIDIDIFMLSRKSTDAVFRRVYEVTDFCSKKPQYSIWRSNNWIIREPLEEAIVQFPTFRGRSYRPIPERKVSFDTHINFNFRENFNRTGVHSGEAIDFSHKSPMPTWSAENGNVGIHDASKGSVAVDESGVYVGGDSGWLYAYSHNGDLRWQFHVADAAEGIHGTPSLDEKYVYVGAYNGRLYRLTKEGGRLDWVIQLGAALGASPVLWKDSLFVGVETVGPNGGYLMRLQRDTGQVLWVSEQIGEQTHSSPAIDERTQLVYLGANNGRFLAFDIQTGRRIWEYKTEAPIKSTPAILGDRVHFTGWDGFMYALDTRDGKLIWRTSLGAKSQSSPTLNPSGDFFVLTNGRGETLGLDRQTGKIRWRKRFDQKHLPGSGVSVQEKNGSYWTWIPCALQIICAFNEKGQVQKQLTLSAAVDGVPTFFNKAMYISERNPGLLRQYSF